MKKLDFKKQFLFTLSGIILIINACKKDKLPAIDPRPVSTKGVYVLCEGAYGTPNNSSITYYDIAKGTAEKNYFKQQNGIDLGSNANDLKQYGNKMYCVISGTDQLSKDSYVEVINIATGKSLKRIPFSDASKGFMPRHIAFYKNKAYVSGYDGYISKIDTVSLTIESRVEVGGALDGLVIVNNKLYVTNSSHQNFPNPNNSSVSVVDLNSFSKIGQIQVSLNPTKIGATTKGDLFVITMGQWSPFVSPAVEKLNSITDTKTQTFNYNWASVTIASDKGFVITGDYPAALKLFNTSTGLLGADFITDNTVVNYFYGVTVNPLDNDVYVADSGTGGKVFCFSADGKKKFEFATGAFPNNSVFSYNYK